MEGNKRSGHLNEDIQTSKKSCAILLVIREMQVKTVIRHYYWASVNLLLFSCTFALQHQLWYWTGSLKHSFFTVSRMLTILSRWHTLPEEEASLAGSSCCTVAQWCRCVVDLCCLLQSCVQTLSSLSRPRNVYQTQELW